jgi:hypothetical protein
MTKTEFQATVEFDDGSSAELEMAADKSWKSFLNYFGEAKHVYCVTYSQSPAFIYKMFQNKDLSVESLEVIVGDNQHDDYRRSLKNTSNATKIAAQLESRRRNDDLLIHTVDSARVLLHTKLYILENQDGSRTLICGSANLSKQAWQGSKQTNVNIAWRTNGDTPVDDWFERLYAFHKEYSTPFMQDLTEEISNAETPEEEAKVYDIWLGGDEFSDDPIAELNTRLDEAVDEDQVNTYNVITDAEEADNAVTAAEDTDTDPTEIGPDRRVRLSPQGLEEAISAVDETLSANNIRINDGEIVATPAGIARYKETFTGYPDLNVDKSEKTVGLRVDNAELELTAPLPEDPDKVGEALDLIERYVETVGEFGETRTTKETRAHFYEGVIYFCWAPFANYCAHHYAEYESAELDKDLPFLFLHGDNDSGKGMFLRFGARLISNGYVQEVMTGDEFIKDNIERARASDTVFPYIVDDVAKQKIDRDIIKSYWEGKWDGSVQMPTFIFSSNDSTKPKSELRTRMKTLDFNVNFSELKKDEREEAAQIAGQADSCNLFPWFAHLFLQRDISLPDQSDRLADARDVFAELYAYADKEPPEYVPLEKPAEQEHDPGRRKWISALSDGLCKLDFKDDGRVVADFSDHLDQQNCWEFQKATPAHVRAGIYGAAVQFESANRFEDWIDEPGIIEEARRESNTSAGSSGVLSKVTSIVRS